MSWSALSSSASSINESLHSYITQALLQENSDASSAQPFYSEQTLSPLDLHLHVQGVGDVGFPLTPQTVQTLYAQSSQAKFGLRDQTLLDTDVRDTAEIPAGHLQITWKNDALNRMLDTMRQDIGLSAQAKLTPHLHNLLIYGPGQFFKQHQDSEKVDGMVATLVVVLPSPHIGGHLKIHQGQKTHAFSSENLGEGNVKCILFYADCPHEVEKVRDGFRVALTYNIVLEPAPLTAQPQANKALEEALKIYFRDAHTADHTPLKLVYFLDHSYTEHSLRWEMLKGVDLPNALAFRLAAEALGLVPHLALTEIRETWDAEGDEDWPRLDELIDSEQNLSFWIDPTNHVQPYGTASIADAELCWTKDTQDFEPFDSEYEGFQGNYGNTMDYWYRRAAVVLWRASDDIMMRFKLNYDAALARLCALTQIPGQEEIVRDTLHQAGSFLTPRLEYAQALKTFLDIAAYIKDASLAHRILESFSLAHLRPEALEAFVKLQELYGVSWCLRLLTSWKTQNQNGVKSALQKDPPVFMRTLIDVHADKEIVIFMMTSAVEQWVRQNKWHQNDKPKTLRTTLPERLKSAIALLKACLLMSSDDFVHKAFEHIFSHPLLYPTLALIDLWLLLQKQLPKAELMRCISLKQHILQKVRQELDQGLRSPDDWSIAFKLPCNCIHCKATEAFLRERTQSQTIFSIVQQDRGHVMEILKDLDLPLEVWVERKGSPHKLILKKTDRLYQDAKETYDKLRAYIIVTTP